MPISKQIDHGALEHACYHAARNMMWAKRPVDTDQIQAVADSMYKHALDHEKYVIGAGRDPNIITRCVEYFVRTHATPSMRDGISVFQDMFEALLELAIPNTAGSCELEEFFCDIEMGIAISRADYHG